MAFGIMAGYQVPVLAGITALAGGGATGAPLLNGMFNSVDTVATGSDSVVLPPAVPGTFLFVLNNQASNALAIFPCQANAANGGVADTLAPASSSTYGTSQTLAANKYALIVCTALGKMKIMLSA